MTEGFLVPFLVPFCSLFNSFWVFFGISLNIFILSSALRAYPATVPHNDIDNANVDNDDNDDNDDAKNDNNSNWQKLPFP